MITLPSRVPIYQTYHDCGYDDAFNHISSEMFSRKVQEMEKAVEDDIKRHNDNLETAKNKKLIAHGDLPPPKVDIAFGHALMKARVAKGWKQKDIALKMNIACSLYADWENSKGLFPNPAQRVKLNQLLGIVLPK